MFQRFEQTDLDALLAGGSRAAALGEMLATYFEFYTQHFGRPSSTLHDPPAAAVLTGEDPRAHRRRHDGWPWPRTDDRRVARAISARAAEHSHGVRIVFDIAEPFAPQLLARLLSL